MKEWIEEQIADARNSARVKLAVVIEDLTEALAMLDRGESPSSTVRWSAESLLGVCCCLSRLWQLEKSSEWTGAKRG